MKDINTKINKVKVYGLSFYYFLLKKLRRAIKRTKKFFAEEPFYVKGGAVFLAMLILFTAFLPIFDGKNQFNKYDISKIQGTLLKQPAKLYADKLVYNKKDQKYVFNQDYTPGQDVAGQSSSPKIVAEFSASDKKTVSVKDPVNNVNIAFTPKFEVGNPLKKDNFVIYPVSSKKASTIYTAQGSGIKEDIVLFEYSKDSLEFKYDITLPDGLEARTENDGSIGVYGVSSTLLGNVSTGTEKDAELLKKARDSGEKNNLIFKVPAPFIVQSNKKSSSARAWFSLEGKTLTIHASGLKTANYPLSIDPSVYVESAQKFMRGNNETNVDFDTTNDLIQKSQTTGARIDGWVDSTDMSAGLWNHSTATAGGYIYRAGGRVDPTMPYLVSTTSTQLATAGTSFAVNMPANRPAGDLYVATLSRVGAGTITPPAGWLLYTTGTNATTTTRDVAMYYRVGAGTEPASYTWTNSASVQWTGSMLRIKNFDSVNPISASTAATTGTATSTTAPIFSAITPAHDATYIIRAIGINEVDPSDFTWLPSGHTKIDSSTSVANTASSTALVVTSLDAPTLATVAAPATSLALDGIMVGNYGAVSVAIRPATVTAGYQNTVEFAQINDITKTIDSPNPGNGVCSGWCADSVYNLPANRVGMSMTAYNGYLFAIGGTSDGTAANGANTVWIAKLGANGEPQLWHPSGGAPTYWYPSTNTLTTAVSYASVAAYKNKLYILGGRNTAGNSINEVRVADFLPTGDIGTWSTTGTQTMPEARHGLSVHIYNDVMYIIGGMTTTGGGATNTFLNTVYLSKLNSNVTMNPWVNTNQNFTIARSSFGGQMTAVWGAYIYLAGGCTATTVSGSNLYCNTIASDVQLASINADGTIAPWNSISTLSNQRIGHSFVAWQGGLYRLGGCNRQNTTSGVCYAVHQNVEYGAVNPPGDASTVSNSEPSGMAPCSGGSPLNCDLPTAGDGAAQGGQMGNAVVVNNGYIYVLGGCTDISQTDECTGAGAIGASSGNVSYAALNAQGQMVAPATCNSPNTSYGLWCVDNTNKINNTGSGSTDGVSTSSAVVFNNRIYVVGGTNGIDWQANVWSVSIGIDGSLNGAWTTQTFANLALGNARGYTFTFTRANPSSATYPGNLFVLGGCNGGVTADGIGCNTYFTEVYKCNILSTGLLEEADATDCDTAGQLQIDADISAGAAGAQGLGLMSGTVYANRIYLIGGSCPTAGTVGACRAAVSANREDTMYASIDNSNNIVAISGGEWSFATAKMSPVRRRAVGFGYNGYIYSLAGYSGSASLQDLLFAKIDVSTGDISTFDSSGVVVTPRWDLRAIVSNGYVYALGGCATGAAPNGCTAMQPEIQTFQLYNNDSGTPISYSASANQFTTDRMGASSTIMNGYLYVAGGCTGAGDCTTPTATVQFAPLDVNGAVGAWSAGNALPAATAWGKLVNAGGALYWLGGQTGATTSTAVSTIYYSSSITAGNPTWATASGGIGDTSGQVAQATTQFGAAVWNNRIYVTGGVNAAGTSQTAVYYSPTLNSGGNIAVDSWTSSTTFNVARNGHTTIAYANNLYVIGGFDGTNYLRDVQFSSIGYKAGTIQQTGTAITGTGTTFTAAMVGSILQYRDGEIATITTFTNATNITVSVSKSVTAGTGYTILDGSVGSWSYTTSLPEPIRQADGFAANGYMYLVGGRSSSGNCVPNTLLAPISANTTIASGNNATGVGEWYETNVKYTGDRYGNSVSYANGKMYNLGGACESFPTVSSITTQAFGTDATTHNVTMPTTVNAGDLLLVLFTNDGSATVTTPAGWTAVTNGTQVETTNVRGSIYAKSAAGTEGGTNVDFVTSAVEQAASQVYLVPSGKWSGTLATGVEAANAAGSSTAAPNPPSLDPTNWATENTLWISYVAGSSYASTTTYPTNHTNGTHNVAGTGGTGATVSSSRRENSAASEDPAAYAMPSTSSGVPFTIAIRPATFAYTGANRTIQTSLYSQPQVAAYSRLIDTDTDVFPNSWLMNGLDNSIGARWQAKYSTMHDISDGAGQQNPNEDCGTSATMPLMTGFGQETNFGNVTLGNVEQYTPKESGGGNINCARYFYFYASIDASQTFGYPEDVNRGPTISDLSLFFTSDPSKRLRHGKTFTGGEKQPLDTPCRVSGGQPNCPLP